MKIHLLYGKNGLDVNLPDSCEPLILKKEAMPLAEAGAVEQALAQPVGAEHLPPPSAEGEVCILICDITRPVPNGLILPPLLKKLLALGYEKEKITILVATGLHRPNLGAELAELVGSSWVMENFKVENHYAQNEADHVDLGLTAQGVSVKLDARFVSAGLKIVTGLVEPHFMAGWSGGRKVITPGICQAETIRTLHSFPFMDHPKSRDCLLEGNPVNQVQLAVLGMLGPVWAVNVVLDEERRLSFVNFGEILAGHAQAVKFTEPYARRDLKATYRTVITSSAGYPLDQTFYQSIKGMVGAARLLAPGGRLFIAAHCGEGLGSPDFALAMNDLVYLGPQKFKQKLKEQKMAAVDEWQAQMMLRALEAGSVVMYTEGLSNEDRQCTAIEIVDDLDLALAGWLAQQDDQRVAVIPEGPYLAPFAV